MTHDHQLHGGQHSLRSCAASATSSRTSSPTRRWPGTQLAVFTDARGLDDAEMQRLAREMNLSEIGVRLPGRGGRARAHPDLHARRRAAVRRAPDARDGVRARSAAAAARDPPRDRDGRRAGRAGARAATGSCSVGWSSRSRPGSRSRTRPTLLGGSGRRALGAAGRALRQRRAGTCTSTLRSEEEVAALRPDLAALSDLPDVVGVNCFAGSGTSWKTRMFAPASGVAEDPATGSAAGPLAVHLARHGRIGFGERDRDLAGRRDRAALDALRARRRVVRARSSGSRSAAAP